MSSKVTTLLNEQFDGEVLQSKKPVLVDFFATWCGPCRALAPVLDDLAGDLAGSGRVVKVDVDRAPELAARYGISSIPCLILFQDGREVKRLLGAVSKARIAALFPTARAA